MWLVITKCCVNILGEKITKVSDFTACWLDTCAGAQMRLHATNGQAYNILCVGF